MKYKAWCVDWSEGPEDACEVSGEYMDFEEAAQKAAENTWENRDGWEAHWPLVFTVEREDGTRKEFNVQMEAVPEFWAEEIKPATKAREDVKR